ncbi:hypothetical protein [Paenibacillus alvei]|uniref:hypothetical protein n=1 Tax=Paenibacillus alvei TaxID=44250 RepID=UPI00227E026C|nr:hypothetical protein [Paenibacillus alvei]
MKRRIVKKQQKAAQRKKEQLQAAWDMVASTLHKENENHCFFVDRKFACKNGECGWSFRLYSLHGFELDSTQVYPVKI